MSEHFTIQRIEQYVAGSLSPECAVAFEAHLVSCDECRELMMVVLEIQVYEARRAAAAGW